METEYSIVKKMVLSYCDEHGNRIHEDNIDMVVEETLDNVDYKESEAIKKAFERALVNLGYIESHREKKR